MKKFLQIAFIALFMCPLSSCWFLFMGHDKDSDDGGTYNDESYEIPDEDEVDFIDIDDDEVFEAPDDNDEFIIHGAEDYDESIYLD